MSNIEYNKNTTLSDKQIEDMSNWVTSFVAANIEALKTTGIKPIDIWNQYKKEVPFAVGPKSLAPMLHSVGLEKISRNVYIIR